MQNADARELRRQWGDKPCDHPGFDREHYLGANTGDHVCTQCGRLFTFDERKAIEASRLK